MDWLITGAWCLIGFAVCWYFGPPRGWWPWPAPEWARCPFVDKVANAYAPKPYFCHRFRWHRGLHSGGWDDGRSA